MFTISLVLSLKLHMGFQKVRFFDLLPSTTKRCNMFFENYECDEANHIDNNTPYVGETNLTTVLSKLEIYSKKLFQ